MASETAPQSVTGQAALLVSSDDGQETRRLKLSDLAGASSSAGAQADPAATTDTGTFSLIALVKRFLTKLFIQGAAAAALYRSAVAAADVLAVPGTVTCTKLTGVGSATAGVYTVFVVAGNTQGRTTATQGNATVTTETTNLGIRAAFAQVVGATFYDIFASVDGAAAKWVGRVTEAQRLSGIIITAVGVTGAGGTANAVDIYVPGTGAAVNAGETLVNAAYYPAGIGSDIVCAGYQYCDLDIGCARTGPGVAFAAILIPFLKDSLDSDYYGCLPYAIATPDGVARNGYSNRQTLRVEVRGRAALAVVVASIAGTGATLDIRYTLN